MNPNEDKLAQFADDVVMFHAVKAIVFSFFDANELLKVPRSEREVAVQAVFDGRIKLEEAFRELAKFKKENAEDRQVINSAV